VNKSNRVNVQARSESQNQPRSAKIKIKLMHYTRDECTQLIHSATKHEEESPAKKRPAAYHTWTLEETFALLLGVYDPRNFSKNYKLTARVDDAVPSTELSVAEALA
jgi:hypothetical protein